MGSRKWSSARPAQLAHALGDDGGAQAVEFFQRQHVGLRQDESQPKIALPVASRAKLLPIILLPPVVAPPGLINGLTSRLMRVSPIPG